jgi:hypothetical protein
MTAARGKCPRAGADGTRLTTGELILLRSRGGHAAGGRVLGEHRAREPLRCQCCGCAIATGQLVVEVLAVAGLLEVCVTCGGGA